MSNNPLGGLGNLLGSLFGQQPPHRQEDYQDFNQRYDRYNDPNDPTDDSAFDQDDVQERYRHMLRNAPPDAFDDAQEEAFQRLSPQQREDLARQLYQYQQQGQGGYQQQVDPRSLAQDPRALGRMLRQTEQQQPGVLDQLFGGAQGALSNPLVKMALAAAAAAAAKRFLSGGNSPLGNQSAGGLGGLGGLGNLFSGQQTSDQGPRSGGQGGSSFGGTDV